MSLGAAVYYQLVNTAGVTAIAGTRVFPFVARQASSLPYIVYYISTDTHEHELSGRAAGLTVADVTIECFASGVTGYATARSLRAAVRNAMDGFRGTMGTSPNTVSVRTCILVTEADSYSDPVDGGEKGTHVCVLDFSIGYLESIPTP